VETEESSKWRSWDKQVKDVTKRKTRLFNLQTSELTQRVLERMIGFVIHLHLHFSFEFECLYIIHLRVWRVFLF